MLFILLNKTSAPWNNYINLLVFCVAAWQNGNKVLKGTLTSITNTHLVRWSQVTVKTRHWNEGKQCQHQWILLIFSSMFSLYTTTTQSQFTVCFWGEELNGIQCKITHTGQTVCVLQSLLHINCFQIIFLMTVHVKYWAPWGPNTVPSTSQPISEQVQLCFNQHAGQQNSFQEFFTVDSTLKQCSSISYWVPLIISTKMLCRHPDSHLQSGDSDVTFLWLECNPGLSACRGITGITANSS